MTTKELGKITFAEFGTIRDYPFLIGLQLGFHMGGSAVMDGGKQDSYGSAVERRMICQ